MGSRATRIPDGLHPVELRHGGFRARACRRAAHPRRARREGNRRARGNFGCDRQGFRKKEPATAEEDPDAPPIILPRNEHEFARLVQLHFGSEIRFAEDQWFVWCGKRWELVHKRGIFRFVIAAGEILAAQATKERQAGSDTAELFQRASIKAGSERFASSVVSWLADFDGIKLISVRISIQARDLLNTPSGTVDLRTGEIREHRREDMLTKITAVDFVRAEAPKFRAFLAQVMPDEAARKVFLRSLGYGLTGEVTGHAHAPWLG